MNKKDFVKDYLQFSYKERIAIITLVAIIVLLGILPHLFPGVVAKQLTKADTAWITAAEKLMQKQPDTIYYRANYNEAPGRDYRPSYAYYRTNYYQQTSYRQRSRPDRSEMLRPGSGNYYNKPVRKTEPIEINIADSAAWEGLPGIGPVLAVRIIKFRDKLGGFYTVEQVKEVYGLQDSVFQKIKTFLKLNRAQVRQINVNTATKDELKIHPYIRWQLASMIVDYRNQHGNFASINDLKKMQLMTDEILAKITPYLTV